MNKLEDAITHLTKTKGLTLQAIIGKIEYEGRPMPRSLFNSWRRSTTEGRTDKLADLIVEVFPEYFANGIPQAGEDDAGQSGKDDYKKMYHDLMQKRVDELTAEIVDCKKRIDQLLSAIVEMTKTSK